MQATLAPILGSLVQSLAEQGINMTLGTLDSLLSSGAI